VQCSEPNGSIKSQPQKGTKDGINSDWRHPSFQRKDWKLPAATAFLVFYSSPFWYQISIHKSHSQARIH